MASLYQSMINMLSFNFLLEVDIRLCNSSLVSEVQVHKEFYFWEMWIYLLLLAMRNNFFLSTKISCNRWIIWWRHENGKKYVAGNKLRSAVKWCNTLVTFQALACCKSPALMAMMISTESLRFWDIEFLTFIILQNLFFYFPQ